MSGVPDAARDADLTLRGSPAPAQTKRGQLTPTWMMQGHTRSVTAVVFFKDSRRVVTGSYDDTMRIWDLETGTSVGGPFEGHKMGVLSVAISPDERRIASGSCDNTIIIWDVESKQMQMVLGPLEKHEDGVRSVCFSPDGKKLASGSKERIIIWHAETGAILSTITSRDVDVVTFSPDGLKFASGWWDGTIRVWRTNNTELLLKIDAHEYSVNDLVWSPNGQQLVSASLNIVKFWNSSNGHQIEPCIGHTKYVYAVAISSDGSFIATASKDTTVRLWSANTHRQIGQALEHTVSVHAVAISPNRELLVSGCEGGMVQLWSIKNTLKQRKAEERINDDEEALRQLFLTLNVTQSRSHNTRVSGGDDNYSLFDILAVNTTVLSGCLTGNLHIAEDLLTQEIDADDNSHDLYANRSVIRARNSEWDKALQDSAKSITVQPSLLGYISKAIALCGNEQFSDAMEAFHLAFVCSDHNPITVDLLRLIEAVALFNAGRHDEALRRVQALTIAHQRSDILPCRVVNLYLRAQLAIITFEDGRYSEAADQLTASITTITDLFSPILKIFTVLFGWDLNSLWKMINQRRCDACYHADRVIEAVEFHQYMMRMIDEDAKDSYLEWSTAFKKKCTARCLTKGDEAVTARNYEAAIQLYSAGIGLDSSCESLFAHRSKADLEQNLYVDALSDADKVIELNPLSYVGYELRHAALYRAQRYIEAIEALKTMLLKSDNAPDAQIRRLRQQYVSPSDVEDAIRRAINAKLENAPLRLINTTTGHLCNREAQIKSFMESPEYQEILYSSMMHAPLQTVPIRAAVAKYFDWVMLSHRWESKEPLLHDVQGKPVYGLDPVGTTVKLQTFCQIARDAGHHWAWSDTCCIDQNNNVELQRSVNSMFVWYRQSALTIVYLSDVPPSVQSGALANSAWNTRGWTVQEFLAPNVILFYRKDWTPYLNDCSPNHKESVVIMKELEDSTGIDAQALAAFRPGMKGAREKLQWASTRATTLQEDIAYSLFGIFGVHLPVIYGETKQNALGRLLQEIVAQSGDITALDWIGKSSGFNSCLPADISSYKPLPCTPPLLSEDRIQTLVSSLRDAAVEEQALTLYTRLDHLSAPRFDHRRLHLPCIAFPVTEIRRRRGQDRELCSTYDVKADGVRDLLITTEHKLIQFSPARPTRQTFLLIRPWNRDDLELPDFSDDAQDMVESMPESPLDDSLGWYPGDDEPVDTEPHARELRLIARLGQPFGALLLAQQRGGEYKRIASDNNIIAQVKDMASVRDMMDVRTLEIL